MIRGTVMIRVLLVLHALLAMALAGAMTHLALVSIGFIRGNRMKLRLGRIYAVTTGVLHLVTAVVGLIIYPPYRFWVAGLYLNRYAVWASNLFDVKEAAALFAVPMAVGLIVVGRKFDATDRPAVPAFAFFALGLWVLDAVAIIAGLLITAERGV